MKADMMEAPHQPAAAQRLDRRATAAGPSGAADAGASSALSEVARRANAGPHASSLAALQAVVAQRACADCETVRRTMGGGAPVQRAAKYPGTARSALPGIRSATSAKALPVQRVRVGPDSQYDTQNPEHYEAVADVLGRMSYEEMEAIRGQLDATNQMDWYHLAAIDYEMKKAKILDAVSAHAESYPPFIPTAASVFVNGAAVFSTKPVSRPESDTKFYARDKERPAEKWVEEPDEQRAEETDEPWAETDEQWAEPTNDPRAEEDVSRNDSEVATLEFAWNDLRDKLAEWSVDANGQPVQLPPMAVRIVLAGLSGPCDGCKERVERFRRDILNLLPLGSSLDLESAYLNRSEKTTRHNTRWKQEVSTEYGWADAEEGRTAHGARYYRHSYPQEIALAPAGAGDFVAADEYGAALFDHGAVQDQPASTSDSAMAGTFGLIEPEADQAEHVEHVEHVEPREEGVADAKRSRSTALEGGADEDEIEAKRRKPEDKL